MSCIIIVPAEGSSFIGRQMVRLTPQGNWEIAIGRGSEALGISGQLERASHGFRSEVTWCASGSEVPVETDGTVDECCWVTVAAEHGGVSKAKRGERICGYALEPDTGRVGDVIRMLCDRGSGRM